MNLCLAILGPTASGKSALAIEIAARLGGEILSLDSAAVYRGLNIGTSKPSPSDQVRVKHHLIDILDPGEPFSAYHFVEKASQTLDEIQGREKLPIVVGGTYFYLRALQYGMFPHGLVSPQTLDEIERDYCEDETLDCVRMHADLVKLDPKEAKKVHPNDRYRLVRALALLRSQEELPSKLTPQPSPSQEERLWMKYALLISRRELGNNIVRRTESMLAAGLVDEVKKLSERYEGARSLQCIGYAEVVRFLNKEITNKQLRNEIIEKTRQLAKRQMTWLRHDPEIRFIDSRDADRVRLEVENLRFSLVTPP